MIKSVVLLSGGVDSALCLLKELDHFDQNEVLCMGIDYGQAHRVELDLAKQQAAYLDVEFQVFDLGILKQLGESSLVSGQDFQGRRESGELNVVLPGRNGLFFRLAGMFAFRHGCHRVVTGVNETDAPEFVDCRRDYIDQVESVLRRDFGTESFEIITPLTGMEKSDIFADLKARGQLDYIVKHSISCYRGVQGEGCGDCPACTERNKGLKTL